MKKIFVMLVVLIGLGTSSVYAQEKYQVSLETHLQFTWEDANGLVYKSEKGEYKTVVREVCADSETNACYKAETNWIGEVNYKTRVKTETINGKTYTVYSYRNVDKSTARRLGQSCR